ncbi:DUF1684 domain-containing protein [Xanthomonas campestris pv. raphani]|uniref:DUF1684 domain-containing protein n=1 Tax=Xanthomonas campestris TaxID=339 RepID=UPI002B2324B0|nr:DUF1684 domain-containing protein [Xanthomonas campestris]MEA9897698.1 DUF1684 domain-containing protein [Xanthomonas campestris pv. raphani]
MRWQLQRGAIGVVGIVLVVACSAGSTSQGSGAAAEPSSARADRDGYAAALAHARAARRAQLHAPDGWLSYTGSGRVRPGRYRVGADPHADIVLPAGPAQLGNLTLDPEGQLRFQAAAGTAVTLHGKPVTEVALAPERAGQPGDRLRIDAREFYVVQTGALYGWRFRDPAALAQFGELDYFPTDAHWRIDAQWQPYDAPRATTLLTSIGTPLTVEVPGEAVFTRNGQRYRLRPIAQDGDARLFFVFADRTSGKESYGGARYLYTDAPRDGRVVLDFNLAENPPCALTPHVVCPIAPPDNRLDLAVNAGEKTYRPSGR